MPSPPGSELEVLERGDIFFLYRPRVGTDRVRGRADVQRFFFVLASEPGRRAHRGRRWRVFVVGRKKLPEILPGIGRAETRNWALNVRTSARPEGLHDQLAPLVYRTRTRGERVVGPARPVGEGRYQLVRHHAHTELAYVLELPEEPGAAQEAFGIQREAAWLVAVRNPDLILPGFPDTVRPHYPDRLYRAFGRRRWLDVEDPELLDHERTQIVLVGAHAGDLREQIGLTHDGRRETAATADTFRQLGVARDEASLATLIEGRFPDAELAAWPERVESRLAPPSRPSRPAGGRRRKS